MTHHSHQDPQDLADALGAVRDEIKTLKAREAQLRAALLEARLNGPVAGHRFAVSFRESTRRSIDTNALPDSIRQDDRFWKTSITRTVVTKSLAPAAPPPIAEEFDLIERW
ncbi:hypothetical protein [Nioella aestuarii]|uniref:hypothetical protein n=1 Tax=Nioella aestuarii TaxID=1662864 RepID=UPI003D7F5E07